jgi:hypothetical protein
MAPRTTTIQNSIEIDRPAEVVFDYCVEPANEPELNRGRGGSGDWAGTARRGEPVRG